MTDRFPAGSGHRYTVWRELPDGTEDRFDCDELPPDIYQAVRVSVQMNFAISRERLDEALADERF
jgi:hypothetical protein